MDILHRSTPAHTLQTKHVEDRQICILTDRHPLLRAESVYVESNKDSPSCLSVLSLSLHSNNHTTFCLLQSL